MKIRCTESHMSKDVAVRFIVELSGTMGKGICQAKCGFAVDILVFLRTKNNECFVAFCDCCHLEPALHGSMFATLGPQ